MSAPLLADDVSAVVEAALSSRERWAAWELRHGLSRGLAQRGSERPSEEQIRAHGLDERPRPSARSQQAILKGARDTRALHAPNGVYSAERKRVHDRIVAHFMSGTKPAGGQPEALFMAGGAASGKTRALDANPHFKPQHAVEVNPDAIKEMLPEYKAMLRGGDPAAAAAVHEESSDIAKRLMHEAQAKRHNVIVDGTGNSKRGKFAGKLEAAHARGYKVRALYVTVPTQMAVDRAIERAHKTGRHVPIPEVRAQHRNVSAWFHDVAGLPFLHEVQVHDTSSGEAHKIASASRGKLTVHDEHAFRGFIDKGRERG